MTDSDPESKKVLPIARRGGDGEMRYEIVLFDDLGGAGRILARAASGQLGQAIFVAAKSEHPGRRIVLRRDVQVLAESLEADPR